MWSQTSRLTLKLARRTLLVLREAAQGCGKTRVWGQADVGEIPAEPMGSLAELLISLCFSVLIHKVS